MQKFDILGELTLKITELIEYSDTYHFKLELNSGIDLSLNSSKHLARTLRSKVPHISFTSDQIEFIVPVNFSKKQKKVFDIIKESFGPFEFKVSINYLTGTAFDFIDYYG